METKRIEEEQFRAENNRKDYSLIGTIGTFATGLLSGIYATRLDASPQPAMEYVVNHPYGSLSILLAGACSVGLLALSSDEMKVIRDAKKLRKELKKDVENY